MKEIKKYQIYDGENNIIGTEEDPVVESQTAKEAILKYLKETKRDYKIKRCGDSRAIFSAVPFTEKNGVKTKIGNKMWFFKLKN